MANNIAVKDASGITQTVKTTESGGVHTPWHMLPDMLEVGPVSVTSAAVLFSQDVSSCPWRCRLRVRERLARSPTRHRTTARRGMLGGNRSDRVCITRIAKGRLYAARRTLYRIQPANVRPVHLASSDALSLNEP